MNSNNKSANPVVIGESPSGLPFDLNFLVNERLSYPGSFVNKRIARAVIEVIDRQEKLAQAKSELIDLYSELYTTVEVTVNVMTAMAAAAQWEALKAWLGLQKSYAMIVAGVKKYNDAIKRQNSESIYLLRADSTIIANTNTQFDQLSVYIDDFENGRITNQELIEYIGKSAAKNGIKDIFINLRRHIDLGGRGEATITSALYNLAYPIWRARGDNRWSSIAAEIWGNIENSAEYELTADQKTVHDAWLSKPLKKRKEQIRNLFRDNVGASGI